MRLSRYETVDWDRLANESFGHAECQAHVAALVERGYSGLWLASPAEARGDVAPALSLPAVALATASGEVESVFEIGLVTPMRPFMHPLRVAEEIAMLDIASEGRVRWTASSATPFDARAREQLAIVRGAVAGTTISFDGEFYRFDDVQCHPAPHRDGGPPIHVASGDAEVAAWAREHGFDFVWDGSAEGASTPPAFDEDATEKIAIVALHVTDAANTESTEGPFITGSAAHCRESLEALREAHALTHLVVRFESGKLAPEEAAASEARFLEQVVPAFA